MGVKDFLGTDLGSLDTCDKERVSCLMLGQAITNIDQLSGRDICRSVWLSCRRLRLGTDWMILSSLLKFVINYLLVIKVEVAACNGVPAKMQLCCREALISDSVV